MERDTMRTTVFALFPVADGAERAVEALLQHGASPNDISVVMRNGMLDHFDPDMPVSRDVRDMTEGGTATTSPADAATGAVAGAGVGLGLGALGALAALAVPGFGLVFGGGALAAALAGVAGATAAGAALGAMVGYLQELGVPEPVIQRFSRGVEDGGALVGVSVPSNNVDREFATWTLRHYGALDCEYFPAPNDPLASRPPG